MGTTRQGRQEETGQMGGQTGRRAGGKGREAPSSGDMHVFGLDSRLGPSSLGPSCLELSGSVVQAWNSHPLDPHDGIAGAHRNRIAWAGLGLECQPLALNSTLLVPSVLFSAELRAGGLRSDKSKRNDWHHPTAKQERERGCTRAGLRVGRRQCASVLITRAGPQGAWAGAQVYAGKAVLLM